MDFINGSVFHDIDELQQRLDILEYNNNAFFLVTMAAGVFRKSTGRSRREGEMGPQGGAGELFNVYILDVCRLDG